MDGRTFYQNILDHDNLSWLGAKQGATPAEDVAIIANTRFHAKFAVRISAIKETPWDQLEGVLTLKRSPRVMTHVTRIVGYYSQLQNWNASKRAELEDRHKGDYGVPEPPSARSASIAA